MLPVSENNTAVPRTIVADERLKRVIAGEEFLLFDGGMGTMLQRGGLAAGELPELLCLSNPDAITAVHRAYVEAGSQAVTTNTFGANRDKLGGAAGVDEVFAAAIACARAASPQYVAADIGPTGTLLEPIGTMSFDEAYGLFAEQAVAAQAHGADLLIIETMADLLEMKAAVLAAKENTTLPIFATMTFGEDGRTFLGTTPAIAAHTLSALGVDALGVNCSLGPSELEPLVLEMIAAVGKPVIVQANAGLPQVVGDKTAYSISPADYVEAVRPMVEAGVGIVGGCCGTDPDYIRGLAALIDGRKPLRHSAQGCSVCSPQASVELKGRDIALIGECINPTGRPRLKEALCAHDYTFVAGEAIAQMQAGADVLDVNVGLPELDEPAVLAEAVRRIQAVCPLPLQIDSSDPRAIEAAVRIYAGKPLVNSVNGTRESMEAVLPIAAHYGCAVLGLTLDDNGIPKTAEERFAIAERIVKAAESWGIPRHDIYMDCVTMSASTNQEQVVEILEAIRMVKERLGVRTVLGASNVSFGLPARPLVNATFLSAAFACGLDMPITNPLDEQLKAACDAWRVLSGQDKGSSRWIEGYAAWQPGKAVPAAAEPAPEAHEADAEGLRGLVLSGLKGLVPAATEELLSRMDAMAVIDEHLIPALDEVGERFEKGVFFLPQLMASAEAAKAGFDTIKAHSGGADEADEGKGPIVIATVKGDIHDIGKNIVRMLLANYGYRVIDLGRDVDPQHLVDEVVAVHAPLVGLSALMTTTVRSMEETIRLLREQAPWAKVFVGGAVLNEEYAQMVGADFYSKDAAAAVSLAAEIL